MDEDGRFSKFSIDSSDSRAPIVLVCCGSFSPPTFSHLRIFETARNHLKRDFNVIGGLFSPVADRYEKKDLAPSVHRLAMLRLAVADSEWIDVDDWECKQPQYTRTANVLESIHHRVNDHFHRGDIGVRLVCGADLVESMSRPAVWPLDLLRKLLGFGVVVLGRDGCDTPALIAACDYLNEMKDQFTLVPPEFRFDVSSSFIRTTLRACGSVRYLVPREVIEYIRSHQLYCE
eukprot:gnl/Trimastix_PCT/3506.p1 GENE.gnl/Trimastix_PCT/3506~~gnl/Trimastix_PCT/3506.p1  ORF type:complete len:232 (+),score=23.96 gnl/Trimastix_PCT/3506:37-732(+)